MQERSTTVERPVGVVTINGSANKASSSTDDPAVISALAGLASSFLTAHDNTACFEDDFVRVDVWPLPEGSETEPAKLGGSYVLAPVPDQAKGLASLITDVRAAFCALLPGVSQVTAQFTYAQEGVERPVCVRIMVREHARFD